MWRDTQTDLLEELRNRSGDIILGGDMAADSPGHGAKYGSYTVFKVNEWFLNGTSAHKRLFSAINVKNAHIRCKKSIKQKRRIVDEY
jgi:hypothetical protein